jgi:hypothetical protein
MELLTQDDGGYPLGPSPVIHGRGCLFLFWQPVQAARSCRGRFMLGGLGYCGPPMCLSRGKGRKKGVWLCAWVVEAKQGDISSRGAEQHAAKAAKAKRQSSAGSSASIRPLYQALLGDAFRTWPPSLSTTVLFPTEYLGVDNLPGGA